MANLRTVESRSKLHAQPKPHWMPLAKGVHLGYWRGERARTWRVRWFRAGKYREELLGAVAGEPATSPAPENDVDDSKLAALTFAQASRRALARAQQREIDGRPEPRTLAEVFKAYFDHRRAHKSEDSADRDEAKVKACFLSEFGRHRIDDLSRAQLESWLKRQPKLALEKRKSAAKDEREHDEWERRARYTANRTWTIVRGALNYAFDRKWTMSTDAWKGVKPFRRVDKPRERALTQHEALRLLAVCESDFRALVQGALYTGCRYGELIDLRVKDVGPAAVYVEDGKTEDARRVVPLNAEAAKFFTKLTRKRSKDAHVFVRDDGEPWKQQDQRPRMRWACRRAKVDHTTFHDLRRTHGSFLVNQGVPLHVIAQIHGNSVEMQERVYARLTTDTKAAAVAKLPSLAARHAKRKR